MLNEYEKSLRMETVLLERDIVDGSRTITEDEARLILENPKLFDYIVEEEFPKKIVGEKNNIKAIFLTLCGIFVENHQIASYNLCVNSESGSGKDYIVKNIVKIFPKSLVESKTRISQQAFTYWHSDPDWNWDGKICYLQDISNDILNSDTFKTMVSDGSSSVIVVDHKAREIAINGKPVIIITTASANPNNELLRRFPILSLDESREQTRAIMRWQSEQDRKGIENNGYSKPIIDAIGHLKRVNVKIPYANILNAAFSSEHIIMRTHYKRLLDLIKSSCAFHQYQREKDESGCFLAQTEDYELARIVLMQTTQNALMIPLTKKQQKFLELCRKEFDESWFSATEISNKCSFLSSKSVYIYLDKLQELFFDTDSFDTETSKRPVKKYRLKASVSINIPSYEDCTKITNNKSDTNDTITTNITINENNCNI